MKRKNILAITTFIVTLILVSAPSRPRAQSRGGDLTKRLIVGLHLKDTTLGEALGNLCVHYGVPVGVEVTAEGLDERRFDVDVESAALKDVLDLLEKRNGAYRWEVRDGVINFTPTSSRDPFLEQLLKVRVRHFAPGRDLSGYEIRDAITELPEVRNLLKEENVYASNLSPASRSGARLKGFELNVSDTDVRGILNTIVRESEHKMWVIERLGAQKQALQISL